jgi:hypothetical protein
MNSRTFLHFVCVAGLTISPNVTTGEPLIHTIKADVWVDNWFALYAGDELIKEDSVPYYTEQSFNAESFTFDIALPALLSVVLKDFKENDSGLEYIGSRRQQMGDGGFLSQFVDAATNNTVAVSDESWRCMTIHQAPINKTCARSSNPEQACEAIIEPEPDQWKSTDFDDSAWPPAVIHSARDVRPHGEFNQVSWNPTARLIWTEDLVTDNTVLCRFTIAAPD